MADVAIRHGEVGEHHSAQIWAPAILFKRARLTPGTYVRVACPTTGAMAYRQARLLPAPAADAPVSEAWVGAFDHVHGSIARVQALPSHRLPTIAHVHLEWQPSAVTLPPPPVGLMMDALLEDGMVWRCRWFGTDYGHWRCRIFPCTPTPLGSGASAVLGVVGKTTQVTFSGHPSSTGFCLVDLTGQCGVPSEALANLSELLLPQLQSSTSSPSHALLAGPLGSGKLHTARQLAKDANARFLLLDAQVTAATDVASVLSDCFHALLAMAPAILCIPHIERIFPKSLGATGGGSERRIIDLCSRLVTLGQYPDRVAVIGTSVDPTTLHPKVRACFTDELSMPVTTLPFRRQLLAHFVAQKSDVAVVGDTDSQLIQCGQQPSDILAVANSFDLASQLARLQLSATKSLVSVPKVAWSDIGGADHIKQQLQEMVVWPFEKPHVFRRMGISPPIGLILYGPPGTGKTMLAKAAATATSCNFLNVTASDLLSSEFGASERALADVFRTAKAMSPCIVFLDEFQSIFANRSGAGQIGASMASQLLQEMDALKALSDESPDTHLQYVFVLAATNALDAIDDAFLQPGRFENILYVGYPDDDGRRQILTLLQISMTWADDVALEGLVDSTKGLSAAEIVSVVRTAGLLSLMRQGSEQVHQEAFDDALLQVWQRHIPLAT
ncbi:hypothetical protein SDRG_16287 [Saprolegnia diclina VS20]|uniref:AAA+ ATPase domain-containing protein n=1 Tax=Saprolegnia diclina (strain VS20) TaxID=1156394 RepID=T0R1G4_SAPDV|nr:hypothetical protein SDRG_16287 [Saprolegnia diclina VS20]EQC25838.1 hypothetical protein SDRG_16287 [Saprolegnia diclina VS20]|eukprot:XP_008620713.1 hypothetical protein SDRG_16287 [Saprolegnia diclina VS20]